MLITRETDYAMRTVRALAGGKRLNIKQICELENIPVQFAYKILKKLSEKNILRIIRGAGGGYCLEADLNVLTMYDILIAIENDEDYNGVNSCLKNGVVCSNNNCDKHCKMNLEFKRINKVLEEELKRVPFINFI